MVVACCVLWLRSFLDYNIKDIEGKLKKFKEILFQDLLSLLNKNNALIGYLQMKLLGFVCKFY